MTFKIEKYVPVPAPRRYSRYPFGDMEVGDSIVVNASKADSYRAANSAYNYGRAHGKKFAARHDGSGLRIWRTA